jgi:hypothetical protein
MHEQHEQHMMADESIKLEIGEFIGGLTLDQLRIFMNIMNAAAQDSDIAYQIEGVGAGCMMYKHGRTWRGDPTAWSAMADAAMEGIVEKVGDGIQEELLQKSQELADSIAVLMEEYGLIQKPGEPYLHCIGCGQTYVSLEDRMLRPKGPAGCNGCAIKMKFG